MLWNQVRVMDSFSRVPVTLAAIAAMTAILSGCIALDAASGVADAGTLVVTATGDIVTSPFDGDDFTALQSTNAAVRSLNSSMAGLDRATQSDRRRISRLWMGGSRPPMES